MTARQCLDHPWLKAAGAEMNVSLPTHNKAAALAQDMVPPSNWNPDRRNSVGKAPTSPSLSTHASKTPGSPVSVTKDQPQEVTSAQEVDMQGETSVPPHPVSSASHSDDLLTKTIEEIGIDTTKYTVMENHSKDSSPSSKRQSVEIPVKKAKCSADSVEMDKGESHLQEQQERLSPPVANGDSVNSKADEPSMTASILSDNGAEMPACVHPTQPSMDSITQQSM